MCLPPLLIKDQKSLFCTGCYMDPGDFRNSTPVPRGPNSRAKLMKKMKSEET
uniref:Uncharacterized protein n=1 Tax=Anopheles albimanus TaxID=7167 RepID=A0A182FZJ4_ANOAL